MQKTRSGHVDAAKESERRNQLRCYAERIGKVNEFDQINKEEIFDEELEFAITSYLARVPLKS